MSQIKHDIVIIILKIHSIIDKRNLCDYFISEDDMCSITIESVYSSEKHLIDVINTVLEENSNKINSILLPKNLGTVLKNSDIYIEEYKSNIDVSFNPVDGFLASTSFSINKITHNISTRTVYSADFTSDDEHVFMIDDLPDFLYMKDNIEE